MKRDNITGFHLRLNFLSFFRRSNEAMLVKATANKKKDKLKKRGETEREREKERKRFKASQIFVSGSQRETRQFLATLRTKQRERTM